LKGYSVEKDVSQDNLGKKIRNAQMEGFNFMGIIGAEELKKS
jgi:threonyl-tRNA synthetase